MKKLLIIMTLFMSSFFLFCRNEVKAYEYIKEVDFSIMEDVISLKEKLDNYVSNSDKYSDYIIYYKGAAIEYYLLYSSVSTYSFTTNATSTYFRIENSNGFQYGRNLNNIYILGGVGSANFIMFQDYEPVKNNIILYSSFDIKYTTSNHSITYNYHDFSYTETFVAGEKMSTLYDVYLMYSGTEQENPHQEEIDKVTNFYTMVIEKIEYLANEISNNYILLFVIGIFMVTFVFLLIFRRFL